MDASAGAAPPAPAHGAAATSAMDPGSVALVALGLVLLFAGFLYATTQDLDAGARDQSHDLALALDIRDGERLTDGNRHPLLPALLAPVAAREPEFFVRARLVTLALVAAGLLAGWLATARVFGAGLALAALAISLFEVRLQARRVCPEPLLAALLVLAVSALARAQRGRGYLAAGGLVGLAWLAKGSAILMLPVFALHLLVSRRGKALLQVFAGFVVVASPLLVWNAVTYGSPIHNANTAHVAWEDRWDEDLDETSTATLSSWWGSHTPADGIARLGSGLLHQRGIEWPLGFLALLLLSRIPYSGVRHRCKGFASGAAGEWRPIAAWTALVWWPAFAWYAPIVSSRRLLFPIVPVLIPPALDLLRGFLPAAARGVRVPRGVATTAAVLLAAGGVALAVAAGAPDAYRHVTPEAARFAESVRPSLPTGTVLARPSRTVPPDWLFSRGVHLVGLPREISDGEAGYWARGRVMHNLWMGRSILWEVESVLLNEGLLRNRPRAFEGRARWDDERGIVFRQGELPPGQVERDARGRVVYVLASPEEVFGR